MGGDPAVVREESGNQAYIPTLVENLQRDDLSPRGEAAALEPPVRERGWSARQVGEAIKRSLMYVSRRLRVFEDADLAPLVLRDGLAISIAEYCYAARGLVADQGRTRPASAAGHADRPFCPTACRLFSPRHEFRLGLLSGLLSNDYKWTVEGPP
jgi:ParB family chromosome partitioning protein